jgi:cell division protein FtsQ
VPVAAPADKRFRRSHVRPSRRRAPWVAPALVVGRLVAAIAALVGAGWYGAGVVADSGMLHVKEIRLRGNQHLSRGDVMVLLSGLQGQHLLRTDLAEWRKRMHGSPWVQQATLRRVLPSTVEVVVQERTPMAIGRIKGDLYLVDEQGVVIDEYGPNYAQFDLPIVDGLAEPGAAAMATVDPARAWLASSLLRALARQPELMRRVSQVDVGNPHDAVLVLEEDRALVHLGESHFADRLRRYLELHEALHSRVPDIEYVDLRFDDRVFVRPGKSIVQKTRAVTP